MKINYILSKYIYKDNNTRSQILTKCSWLIDNDTKYILYSLGYHTVAKKYMAYLPILRGWCWCSTFMELWMPATLQALQAH